MRAVEGGCDASGCESDVAWLNVLGTASRGSRVRNYITVQDFAGGSDCEGEVRFSISARQRSNTLSAGGVSKAIGSTRSARGEKDGREDD